MMGCVVARSEFVDEHPELVKSFLEEYHESVEYCTNVDEVADYCVEQGIIPSIDIAKAAIPNCNITYVDGADMKERISGYFGVLFDSNPASIGGALPNDSFYYAAENKQAGCADESADSDSGMKPEVDSDAMMKPDMTSGAGTNPDYNINPDCPAKSVGRFRTLPRRILKILIPLAFWLAVWQIISMLVDIELLVPSVGVVISVLFELWQTSNSGCRRCCRSLGC